MFTKLCCLPTLGKSYWFSLRLTITVAISWRTAWSLATYHEKYSQSVGTSSRRMVVSSLVPRPIRKIGERAWYPLFAHALNFPTFQEFRKNTVHLRVMWHHLRARSCSINRISLTMASVQGVDSALSYALQRLGCEAMMLKPQQRESVKSVYEGKDVFLWLPTGFGKSLCYAVLPSSLMWILCDWTA